MHIKVPATSANLGPGFDCLGLALKLYNEIQVELAEELDIAIEGEGSNELPKNRDNLFYQSFAKCYSVISKQAPHISVSMFNRIPLARGLGSSASIIIAGVLAANHLSQANLSSEQILQIASDIEGHPDNVAAALAGGLTVSFQSDKGVGFRKFEPSGSIGALVFIPGNKLSTKEARGVLPKKMDIGDCVFNISRASLLVGSLINGDLDAMETAVEDKIHQPYRMPLLGDYERLINVLHANGVKAVALSGAGPSLIAFVGKEKIQELFSDVTGALKDEDLNYETKLLDIDMQGAKINH